MDRTVEEAQRAPLRHFDCTDFVAGAGLFARRLLKEAGVTTLEVVVQVQQERELRLAVAIHVEAEVAAEDKGARVCQIWRLTLEDNTSCVFQDNLSLLGTHTFR